MKHSLLFIAVSLTFVSFSFSQVKKIPLANGTKDTIIVSNSIHLGTDSTSSGMDPLGGVVLFSTNNTQDGTAYFDKVCFGTNVWKSKPDTVIFTSVGGALYLFVPQELTSLNNNINGHYDVMLNSSHFTLTLGNVIFLDERTEVLKVNLPNSKRDTIIVSNSMRLGTDSTEFRHGPFRRSCSVFS